MTPRSVKPRLRSRGAGSRFTLMELIVVMGLMGTILTLAAPSLRNMLSARSLRREGRRMLTLTQYAAGETVSEGRPLVLWYDVEASRYGLAYGDGEQQDLLSYTTANDVTLEIDNDFCDAHGMCVISVFPDGTAAGLAEEQEIRLVQTVTGEALTMTFAEDRRVFQLEAR